jgi:hypothetical protein
MPLGLPNQMLILDVIRPSTILANMETRSESRSDDSRLDHVVSPSSVSCIGHYQLWALAASLTLCLCSSTFAYRQHARMETEPTSTTRIKPTTPDLFSPLRHHSCKSHTPEYLLQYPIPSCYIPRPRTRLPIPPSSITAGSSQVPLRTPDPAATRA